MATKKTKAQLKQEAETLRVKAIGLMGLVASPGGDDDAEAELVLIANILLGAEFTDLLASYSRHNYRPTIRSDVDPRLVVLADIYDFFQARAGYDVKAYRSR